MPIAPSGKPRSTSNTVATKPACASLKSMYSAAEAAKPKSWNQVEAAFLTAMEGFDANVAAGVADQGDRQNGKGDFFNDLLALLLEGCAGVQLYSRGEVPGFVFPMHNLDVSYPNTGMVEFTLEAKAVGTPKHPGNTKQKNPLGRPGDADLEKRVKEVAFKVIDLKAEFGRMMAIAGESPESGPGGDLTSWLRSAKPLSYLFISARVVSKQDLAHVVRHGQVASQVCDGVGLYCYTPKAADTPTEYVGITAKDIPPSLQLERVLYRACQDLTKLKGVTPTPIPATAVGPAVETLSPSEPDDE